MTIRDPHIACAITAALCLGLAACGVSLPDRSYYPSQADHTLFDQVEQAWADAGLDAIGPACAEARERARIVVAGDEDFPGLCSGYCSPGNCPGYRGSAGCPWGCAGACYTSPCVGSWPHCWGTGNEFLGGHETPLLVTHERKAEADGYPSSRLIAHEYLHLLGECTGRGADDGHADGERWRLEQRF